MIQLLTGVMIKKLEGRVGAENCVATIPKYQQIAVCTNTAMWNYVEHSL
jgi:hypothetical protein